LGGGLRPPRLPYHAFGRCNFSHVGGTRALQYSLYDMIAKRNPYAIDPPVR
jgi:hypothetical protein